MPDKVQSYIQWWSKFNQENIIINGTFQHFKVKLNDNSLLHLLGVQYINKDSRRIKGKDLLNYVRKNKLTDKKIYDMIQKNNPDMLDNVKDRIDNFKGFMENLENAYIVEMTNPNTRIKSNYLIIRTEESKIMQLGIKDIGYEDVLETFLVEKDNIYFRNTTINEPIVSIQKYNENGELEKFSFKENPDNKIIKDADIINDLEKENINKQISIKWNKNNINVDLER